MTAKNDGKLFFLGIARTAREYSVIVASNSYNAQIDNENVHQILNDPCLTMNPGKHYSFSANTLDWHLISDEHGLIYIMISVANYPSRCALTGLEELKRVFQTEFGERALTAKEGALNKPAHKLLLRLCQKYDNLSEIDALSKVNSKVESVKLLMNENIKLALESCVKLDRLQAQSEELSQASGVFARTAKQLKDKMWWKQFRMYLLIGVLILVVLGVIIGVSVAVTNNK